MKAKICENNNIILNILHILASLLISLANLIPYIKNVKFLLFKLSTIKSLFDPYQVLISKIDQLIFYYAYLLFICKTSEVGMDSQTKVSHALFQDLNVFIGRYLAHNITHSERHLQTGFTDLCIPLLNFSMASISGTSSAVLGTSRPTRGAGGSVANGCLYVLGGSSAHLCQLPVPCEVVSCGGEYGAK